MRLVLVLIALAGLCASAWAYPTLTGPSGIVQTPTTDITEEGTVDFAADHLSMDDANTTAIRLTTGITDKAELGIAYLKFGNDLDGRLVNFHGKFSLQREPACSLGLAVGIEFGDLGEDMFEAAGVERLTRVYAVASKMLTPLPDAAEETVSTDIRGHVGLAFSRVENGDSKDSIRPFLGLEFATRRGTVFGVEWRSEEFGDDVISAVVRHPFNGDSFLQVGITKNPAGLAVSDETSVFAGLGWRFETPE